MNFALMLGCMPSGDGFFYVLMQGFWLLPLFCFALFGWLIVRLIQDAEQTFA